MSTTRALIENTAKPTPQNHLIATTAPKVFRETAQIVWDMPVQRVRNFIHGHSPTPCAWTLWNGSTLKVYRAAYSTRECRPWEWFISESELIAGCSDGSLSLTEVQLPGKRRMKIADVLRGYRGPVNGSFAHIEQS